MKIIKVTERWGHADFAADYECGHCGNVQHHGAGYADANFHNNVVPNMPCEECGKTGKDEPDTNATTLASGSGWAVGKHNNFPLVMVSLDRDPCRLRLSEAKDLYEALKESIEAVEADLKEAKE